MLVVVMVAAKRNMAAGRTSGMGGYLQSTCSEGRGAAVGGMVEYER